MPKLARLFFILILFAIFSCTGDQQVKESFAQSLANIQKKYAPDLSLEVFDVRLEKSGGRWRVSGEVTSARAAKAVRLLADSLLKNYENRLTLLPDPALGDSVYGIVKLSVAHLRRQPRHAAELVDQVILGRPVKLLKRQRSWYLVQTEYRYIGWMTGYSFHRTDSAGAQQWEKSPLYRVNTLFAEILSQPRANSPAISDAVMNATVKLLNRNKTWAKVALPDGREGFIRRAYLSPVPKLDMNRLSGEQITKTAKTLLGIPYLWGGNSAKACDCSGFTQNVFRANGILLPRDARQQAKDGSAIIPKKDFSNVKPGDLLFFGPSEQKITHVGISLGGYDFIHQDSDVHIDSFDSTATNYNAYRKKTLRKIKRILKN